MEGRNQRLSMIPTQMLSRARLVEADARRCWTSGSDTRSRCRSGVDADGMAQTGKLLQVDLREVTSEATGVRTQRHVVTRDATHTRQLIDPQTLNTTDNRIRRL